MSVVLLETIEKSAQQRLFQRASTQLVSAPNAFEEAHSPEEVRAVITRGKGQITRNLLDHFPKLKLVARCGVGLDNLDINACKDRSVAIFNTPGATTTAVAEQTFYLMLAIVRNLNPIWQKVQAGEWNCRNHYHGDDLRGKMLGLIGMGDIASEVAKMAAAFGMQIQFCNHRPKDSPYPQVSFEALLASSDIVSIHLPLTNETREMINRETISIMKDGTYLINTARGGHLNHSDVLDALHSGKLQGFGADVFDPEPANSDNPLLRHPHAVITPHISALTNSTYLAMSNRTVDNVLHYLTGLEYESDALFLPPGSGS